MTTTTLDLTSYTLEASRGLERRSLKYTYRTSADWQARVYRAAGWTVTVQACVSDLMGFEA